MRGGLAGGSALPESRGSGPQHHWHKLQIGCHRTLLWVREAYGLQTVGSDLPPKFSDTSAVVADGAVAAEARTAWESRWVRAWNETVAHTAREHNSQLFAALGETALGSTERIELLHTITGPNWRDEFGNEPFDNDSYRDWSQRGVDTPRSKRPLRLENHPERRDLQALVSAWEAGLTKIITIPCDGSYTRKVGPNALLVTDPTRGDSGAYREALGSFL